MLRRLAILALATALLAASCGGEGEAAIEPINRSEEVPVEIAVEITGDLSITLRETIPSNFIVHRTANTSEDSRNTQIVGTEPLEPIKYGSAAILPGIGLIPYDGDGTYTITEGSPFDAIKEVEATQKGPLEKSSIKIDWWPNGDITTEPETFMRRAKPCKVVVDNKGTRGTVTCPDVTNEARTKHFSFKMSWVAPTTPAPTTSTAPMPTEAP